MFAPVSSTPVPNTMADPAACTGSNVCGSAAAIRASAIRNVRARLHPPLLFCFDFSYVLFLLFRLLHRFSPASIFSSFYHLFAPLASNPLSATLFQQRRSLFSVRQRIHKSSSPITLAKMPALPKGNRYLASIRCVPCSKEIAKNP